MCARDLCVRVCVCVLLLLYLAIYVRIGLVAACLPVLIFAILKTAQKNIPISCVPCAYIHIRVLMQTCLQFSRRTGCDVLSLIYLFSYENENETKKKSLKNYVFFRCFSRFSQCACRYLAYM